MQDIIRQIESAYGFSIYGHTPAPRGWWAETYRLETAVETYFFKMFVPEMCFEAQLRASLEAHSQMAAHIPYVPKPIPSLRGELLHTLENGRKAALYTYIDGVRHHTDDVGIILGLMTSIYGLDIQSDSFCRFGLCGEAVMNGLQRNVVDTPFPALLAHMRRNRDTLLGYWDRYVRLAEKVSAKRSKLYLTHGDLGVNLMIDRRGQVHIVDWDGIQMGPIERDLREFIHDKTDISQLEAIARRAGLDWSFDSDYHNYFLLNSLYDDLDNFFYEIDAQTPDGAEKIAGRTAAQQVYIDRLKGRLIGQAG